ncbi:MAG TPA: DUF302 domain-containing protein [Candidatus Methylomirabilis sp.]
MLPCNVIVQEREPGQAEVAAVDPMTTMQAVGNPKLKAIAERVRIKLKRAVENL